MASDSSPHGGPRASSGRLLVAALLLALATAVLVVLSLPIAQQERLLEESGLFESASVVGYAACILTLFARWGFHAGLARWPVSAVLLVMALRELDLDKAFSRHGLFHIKQYTSGEANAAEVMLCLALLALIAWSLVRMLQRDWRPFWRGLAVARPAPLAVFLGLALAALSKAADGLGRKLADFGIAIGAETAERAHAVEEIAELGIPLAFLVAIVCSYRD